MVILLPILVDGKTASVMARGAGAKQSNIGNMRCIAPPVGI
jgi:hypothetical protein